MKRAGLVVMAMVVAVLAATTMAQVRADVALRAAVEQETVKGDLKGAIEAYRKIVDGYPDNRSVRAQALVRMAGCYQKLGDAQAADVYNRVVREFSDQGEAVALARTSLTRMSRPVAAAALTVNQMLWSAPPSFYYFTGDVTSDGRLVPYIDWEGARQDLNVYDLTTGRSRRLVAGGRRPDGTWASVGGAALSRDGSQLAYVWSEGVGTSQAAEELRVINMAAGDTQKQRPLLADATMRAITPRDWSPDGGSLALDIERKDGRREVGVVSVRTGALRILKSVNARRASGMRFSPDGQYLLFDTPGDTSEGRDIVGVNLRNGSDIVVDAFPGDDSLLGFTPDGAHIVFESARSGAPGLWTAAFKDGITGRPALVKSDLRMDSGYGISSTGSLFHIPSGRRQTDVRMGAFDVRTGRFTAAPVDVTTEAIGTNVAPRFSPDGRSLAFISERPHGDVVVIQTVSTGTRRDFRLPLRSFRNGNKNLWKWNAAGTGLFAVGTSASGQEGIHFIDVATGTVAWSIPAKLRVSLPREVDGSRLSYSIGWEGTRELSLFEWDLATKTEKVIYRTADECYTYDLSSVYCLKAGAVVRRDVSTASDTRIVASESRARSVSPDERYLVTYPSARVMLLTDLQTGQSRELLWPERSLLQWWAPGNTAVLAIKPGIDGKPSESWWIPIDGSTPHRISEMDGAAFTQHAAPYSADGRLVFEVSAGQHPPTELWVLENFLPPAVRKPRI